MWTIQCPQAPSSTPSPASPSAPSTPSPAASASPRRSGLPDTLDPRHPDAAPPGRAGQGGDPHDQRAGPAVHRHPRHPRQEGRAETIPVSCRLSKQTNVPRFLIEEGAQANYAAISANVALAGIEGGHDRYDMYLRWAVGRGQGDLSGQVRPAAHRGAPRPPLRGDCLGLLRGPAALQPRHPDREAEARVGGGTDYVWTRYGIDMEKMGARHRIRASYI